MSRDRRGNGVQVVAGSNPALPARPNHPMTSWRCHACRRFALDRWIVMIVVIAWKLAPRCVDTDLLGAAFIEIRVENREIEANFFARRRSGHRDRVRRIDAAVR